MLHLTVIASPLGPLTLATRGGRLCVLHFGADRPAVEGMLRRWYGDESLSAPSAPMPVVARLESYFGGETTALDGIDVELNGTPFQRRVWEALRGIRVGQTASYGDIARSIDAPTAVRAVGAANGANPVAIVVPCHRIIGTGGSLTGYGGGLDRKRWLLQHEGAGRLF
ncbi:MAG: methylated-DNA--[protein]-cysteine S-methyltransferase [Vicinamibacterales bacterium]